MTNEQAMRDAFEASVTDKGKHPQFAVKSAFYPENYGNTVLQFAWVKWREACAWQASRADAVRGAVAKCIVCHGDKELCDIHDCGDAHSFATWQHAANEWADAATSGLSWIKSIGKGDSTIDQAVENVEALIKHARSSQPAAQPTAPVDALTSLEILDVWRSTPNASKSEIYASEILEFARALLAKAGAA